jgi:gas vesicle protein
MRSHNGNGKSFVKGAAIGAALGAVLGILFAPDSGKKTRQKIKKAGKDAVGKGKDALEAAKMKVEDVASDIAVAVTEKGDLVEEKVEKGTKKVKRLFKGTKPPETMEK